MASAFFFRISRHEEEGWDGMWERLRNLAELPSNGLWMFVIQACGRIAKPKFQMQVNI